MKASLSRSAALVCHPATPSDAVGGIEARVGGAGNGALAFTYIVRGNLDRLRIPPPRAPRRADRLWQHTCFEVFMSVKGEKEYYEFNFAPSGEWAVYGFTRYREPAPLADMDAAPAIVVHHAEENFQLDAAVELDRLPGIPPREPLKLALAAVIEDDRGKLSYWALKHPSGKPDFHHADGFTLEFRT